MYQGNTLEERRTGLDRRSNWNDALQRLKLQDEFLEELDSLLNDMLENGRAEEETKFDSDIAYWAERLNSLKVKYKR